MIRGLLSYDSLQSFVRDHAAATTINKPLPGGQEINYYRWWDQYYFAQDEWKLHPTLTLNLGLRYELPGNNMSSLIELNEARARRQRQRRRLSSDACSHGRSEQPRAPGRLQLGPEDERHGTHRVPDGRRPSVAARRVRARRTITRS